MRTQSLKTYVSSKFKEYYNKPLWFKSLLEDSKNDSRLAELAQVHFLLKSEQDKADAFVFKTKERFLVHTFMLSDQKYVYQYKKQAMARDSLNRDARARLKRLFKEENVSKYQVAKRLGTHQSNLSEFVFKFKDNKLDANKVLKVYGW